MNMYIVYHQLASVFYEKSETCKSNLALELRMQNDCSVDF